MHLLPKEEEVVSIIFFYPMNILQVVLLIITDM